MCRAVSAVEGSQTALRGGETLQDGEMGFMYQAPPGFHEEMAARMGIPRPAAAADPEEDA